MASQVEIANRALTKIGEARILSLSDDVEAARVISSLWGVVRDSELRARNWNFSITRTTLAALASAPSWGYSYQYQLPSNCLRVLQAGEYFPGPSMSDYRNSSEAVWQIEGGRILTDLGAPLKIRYVARVEDTGVWDAAFNEVFACKLAIEVCERVTQSNTKREFAWEEYNRAISMAVRADAIENPPEPLPDDSWMLSRL
jgi:hypothetical protein|nr:MAG TPA: tail tubular protein [Caudoviricetes sp.]